VRPVEHATVLARASGSVGRLDGMTAAAQVKRGAAELQSRVSAPSHASFAQVLVPLAISDLVRAGLA
jgi:hypothetical protein